jgi:hypothetical protein
MSYARQMLDTRRQPLAVDAGLLAAAIDAASDCAQACAADTDADLNEQDLAEMVTCIRLCLDCTDICTATAAVLSRPAEHDLNATRLGTTRPGRPSRCPGNCGARTLSRPPASSWPAKAMSGWSPTRTVRYSNR